MHSTYVIAYVTKGDTLWLVAVTAGKRPSWRQMSAIVPGYVTGEVLTVL